MTLSYVSAKSLLTPHKNSPHWFYADYNTNIYRGCSHGCIYCDSRSSCYGDFAFDTVKVKANALEILERQLHSKRKKGIVATGAMSDPYNPLEEQLELTRGALNLFRQYGYGVVIYTKSHLILRDLDLLVDIQKKQPVVCALTITCADDELGKTIESHAPTSSQRFEALTALSDAGLFTGILMMPILPFINDSVSNVEGIVEMANRAGARFIYPSFGVTLRDVQRAYFLRQIYRISPDLQRKYETAYKANYYCSSPNADDLWHTFSTSCEKHGLLHRIEDIVSAYRRDTPYQQLSLFDRI